MAKPVLVVVDDEDASLRLLTGELESRYGAHYRIVASSSAAEALARLAELRADGASVPVILADQWMPGSTGTELLARARDIYPTARRGLMISWGDRSAAAPISEAAAIGQMDFFVPKPAWAPDEQFHRAITEALDGWWRQRGKRFEAVTVIGADLSARAHEIRDVLTRTSVPFGFYRRDSVEGQAALERLGVPEAAGPVVALYNGGGNSAGQAALHLAKHAQQVTILVRSESLAASMSHYLIQEIDSAPNVEVRYQAEVTGGGGDGRLERLDLRDQRTGRVESVPAEGLFVLIGAEPFTDWLPAAVGRDQWGFVLTGPDTGRAWPLERAPSLFETSLPGVFAVGDARHGSVKRVASAVGEGSIAIRLIHDYLALTSAEKAGHE